MSDGTQNLDEMRHQHDLRNARLAKLEALHEALMICADVLHYVPGAELKRGLEGFPELCCGVAYIDVFCREDAITGDFRGFIARSRAQYRKLFDSNGLTALGSHCYLSPSCDSPVSALERL